MPTGADAPTFNTNPSLQPTQSAWFSTQTQDHEGKLIGVLATGCPPKLLSIILAMCSQCVGSDLSCKLKKKNNLSQ